MTRVPFPEKYIRHGEFLLHSGAKSDIFYDVNSMLTDDLYLSHILRAIPMNEHYVGIVTGGALLAMACHVKYPYSKLSLIRDGKLMGDRPENIWYLIDDVVTTGKSLLEAISIVGTEPKKTIVAIDRREKNEKPEVISIFQPLSS